MKIDIRYILGLALAVILYYFVGGYTGRAFLIIAVTLFAISLLQTLNNLLSLRTSFLEKSERIEVGDEGKLGIRVTNKGLFTIPHIVSHVIKNNDRRIVSVLPRSYKDIGYDFVPRVRGTVDIGIIDVTYSDALNIISLKKSLKPSRLRVYPKIKRDHVNSLVFDTIGEGDFFKTFSKENPYLIREHRKYKPGDSFRRINWKISAKLNELFIKEGESTEERDILIVLDMNKRSLMMDDEGVYENALVTDALALSRGLIKKEMAHGFIINNDEKKYFIVDSFERYTALEEYLVDTKSTGKRTLDIFCLEESETLLERGTLIFVAMLDEKSNKEIARLKNIHNEVMVLSPNLLEEGIDQGIADVNYVALKGEEYVLD